LYDDLKRKYPQANFIIEDENGAGDQIIQIIKDVPKEKNGHELLPFFSFMVDDMIFFKDLNLLECVCTL